MLTLFAHTVCTPRPGGLHQPRARRGGLRGLRGRRSVSLLDYLRTSTTYAVSQSAAASLPLHTQLTPS